MQYVGGPQDVWDIQPLLMTEERPRLVAEVEREIGRLPADSSALWQRILAG